jgi:hypothetical protein
MKSLLERYIARQKQAPGPSLASKINVLDTTLCESFSAVNPGQFRYASSTPSRELQKPKGEHRRQDWLTLKGTEYQHSISQGPTAP